MFSHIAEETARLSHGFLGALFSCLLVFSNESSFAISILCLSLFSIFIASTMSLHFLFKAVHEENSTYFVYTLICVLVYFSLFLFTIIGFAIDISPIMKFSTGTYPVIRVGLVVFATFLVALNISHIAAIYHLKRARSA